MAAAQPVGAQTVPFLPGHSFHDVTRQQHSKPQTLVYKLESATQVLRPQQVEVPASLLAAMRERADWRLDKSKKPASGEELAAMKEAMRNTYKPAVQPPWLQYDRQVLRFYAYFQEAVQESGTENSRLRSCALLFFPEDGTIQVSEPRVENSGLTQGTLVKRHRIPRADGQVGYYTAEDLKAGSSITLYGRTFRLIGCDAFTRWWMEQHGLEAGEEEEAPVDAFFETEIWKREHAALKTGYPREVMKTKEYNELKLGGSRRNTGLEQYLLNDGKVLRLYAYWDDHTRYGTRIYYVLHYFLADDTVEINERYARNSGRDPYPVFYRRAPLAKKPTMTYAPGMDDDEARETYKPVDLRVGHSISVYGRAFTLYDCDDFTRDFYKRFLQWDQPKLSIEEPRPRHMALAYPPHTGIGSEEDSLGSCLSLRPKAPKMDLVKLLTNAEKVLRFEAVMDNNLPEDVHRKFVVGIFLADDTVAVWEQRQRNSGHAEGKFAERGKKRNPATGRWYVPSDFFVGGRVVISGASFALTRADEYTLVSMEKSPEAFPMSDPAQVAAGLRDLLSEEHAAVLNTPSWPADPFREEVARRLGVLLCDQELITLLRACGEEESACISSAKLADVLRAVDEVARQDPAQAQ